MSDRVPVPQAVFDGIEAVRLSGLTNMLDRPRVAELAAEMGFEESAKWVRDHRDLYAQAIFRGFEVTPQGASTLDPQPERAPLAPPQAPRLRAGAADGLPARDPGADPATQRSTS